MSRRGCVGIRPRHLCARREGARRERVGAHGRSALPCTQTSRRDGQSERGMRMQTRTLGRYGPAVPVIGFGAYPIAGQMGAVARADALRAVRRSIELGSTLIDTAETYGAGLSEEMLGEALKGQRHAVFVATKVAGGAGHLAYASIIGACEASLQRLQTDYVDLYQCHWVDPTTPVEESMRAME